MEIFVIGAGVGILLTILGGMMLIWLIQGKNSADILEAYHKAMKPNVVITKKLKSSALTVTLVLIISLCLFFAGIGMIGNSLPFLLP